MWLVAFLFHKIRLIAHLFSFYLVHFRLLCRLSYIFLKPLFSAVKQNKQSMNWSSQNNKYFEMQNAVWIGNNDVKRTRDRTMGSSIAFHSIILQLAAMCHSSAKMQAIILGWRENNSIYFTAPCKAPNMFFFEF